MWKWNDSSNSYQDMVSGRLDTVAADIVEDKAGLLDKPEGKPFELVSGDLNDALFNLGTGAALRKTDTVLRDRINAALKAIRAKGIYKKIADRYFSFDVYGD